VVQEDEHERTGRRAILNFGHTVGHAIEQLTGYGPVLHGEAIAVGMLVEARLGELLGVSEPGTADAVEGVLAAQRLPTRHEILYQSARLIDVMRRDKKSARGQLTFSLLERLGACRLFEGVSQAAVEHALIASCGEA